MPEFEQHGWQGFWLPGRRCSGQYGIVVIVKRRFDVDTMDALCKPVPTDPVSLMAEYFDDGEVPMVSVRHPSEIAYEKPNCDVMVRGTAYAPGGKAVPQYFVMVGGGTTTAGATFARTAAKVPARRIPEVVERLIHFYGREKADGESATSFFQRIDIPQVKALLTDLEQLTEADAMPDDFIDLAETGEFAPEVMEGECSA